jgi:hypothetical protein
MNMRLTFHIAIKNVYTQKIYTRFVIFEAYRILPVKRVWNNHFII